MPAVDRIETLKIRHEALEAALREEIARPHPDDRAVATLKRQKLKIKDLIKELAQQ